MEKEDLFKKEFKYYKLNRPKPTSSEVITVDDSCNDEKVIYMHPDNVVEDSRVDLLGLHRLSQWKLYSLRDHPGLLFIRNLFTPAGQRYWIRRCLEVYPKKTNRTNIDSELSLQDWWAASYEHGECNRQLQKKLRWTTLGYHHNWDTKIYSDENKSKFPEDLAELSDVVACYLGYTSFRAEAAIVNYYHMDSTLSGHTDHSEVNLEAPLFSFSFGQSAVFLIGGKDKTIKPSAILLRSGDVAIMSKEARLCYHAVPKILPALSSPWNDHHNQKVCYEKSDLKYISNPEEILLLTNKNADNSEWNRFNTYIEESRINMNVRQVLNDKHKSLADSNFNDTE